MKQVYLFEPVNEGPHHCSSAASLVIVVKSSREKAISACNRVFANPDFEGDKEFTTVTVDGSTVGWITKKYVQ